MGNRFQLNCVGCGQPTVVTAGQAGGSAKCRCGVETPVPTLRELRALPLADDDDTQAGRSDSWDRRRGALFVCGAVAVALGAALHWRIAPQRVALTIEKPAFQEMNFDVQQLQPVDAWEAWVYFRQQTLDYRATPDYLLDRVAYRELTIYLMVAWMLAGLGVVLIAASLIWRPRSHPASR